MHELMNGTLSSDIRVRKQEKQTVVEIDGVVDEGARLEALVEDLSGAHVVFDLKGLQKFSSPGIQSWQSMIRVLSERAKEILYINVPEQFLIHCHLNTGFKGVGRMGSVQVEYICEGCYRGHPATLMRERDFPNGHVVPRTGECETCGAKTFLDDLALPEVL